MMGPAGFMAAPKNDQATGGELITLDEWARVTYQPPPSIYTLRRWARDGKIYPLPQKHGRSYYVRKDARYVDDYNSSSFLEAVRATTTAQ